MSSPAPAPAPDPRAPLSGHAGGRLRSLDVFRGVTIVGMVLVNNPGSWSHIYAPLRHAPWHGWTPTDLIFPFFLFIVGAAMAFSLARRREQQSTVAVHLKILQRAAVLFALGLLLSGFPYFDLAHIRIMGVLQRIALAYLFASLLVLHLRPRWQIAIGAAILLGYWALLTLVPAPGREVASLAKGEDITAWVDRAILTRDHLWRGGGGEYDPEGLLSTLPAIVTVLAGYWTGLALRRRPRDIVATGAIAAAGAGAIALGLAWDQLFPINKALWTSSYVVFSAGCAMIGLAATHAITDLTPSNLPARLLHPFNAVGRNAILVFVASGLLARTLSLLPAPSGEGSFKAWLAAAIADPFESAKLGSLLFALLNIALWLLIAAALDRRRWYLKV